MNQTEADFPCLAAVLARLSMALRRLDSIHRDCATLAGARKRAEWLLAAEPELRSEFSTTESLAGYLLSLTKQRDPAIDDSTTL